MLLSEMLLEVLHDALQCAKASSRSDTSKSGARTPCKWMTGSLSLLSVPLKLLVAAAAIATTADIYQFFAVSSPCSAAAGIG